MRFRLSVGSLLGLVLLLAGCGSKGEKKEALPGDAAARVNGETIPLADVTKVATNFKKQKVAPDSLAQGTTPEERLYYTVVDRLVEQTLVLQESKKQGLEITDAEIQSGIDELKTMAGGEEGFQKLLADHAITLADIQRDMRTNLVMKQFFDKVKNTAPPVTDADIQKFYDENPQHFAPQPEVHARHILIRTRPGMSDMEKAEARKRAEGMLKRARGGEDFAKLAEQNSEDEISGPQGGDLSWFGRGQMVAPFDSVVFGLAQGQVGGVVETPFGYHVIKVEETRTSAPRSLDEVKEGIRGMLAQGKSQEAFRSAVADLRAKAELTIQPPSPEILAAIKSEG